MKDLGSLDVVFAGDLNDYSKGYSRLKAMCGLGVPVRAATQTPIEGGEGGFARASLAFRVAWKLGFHLDTEGINSWLIDQARQKAPDVIWIEKGNMVRPSTLRRLKNICPGAVLVSYTDDDMFNPVNRSVWYRRGLKEYDLIFTTKSYNANPDELPAMGAKKVIMVDKAYDPDHHHPIELMVEESDQLSCDVGFIGSFEAPRAADMDYLAGEGIPVRVWGNGWSGYRPRSGNLAIENRALVNSGGNPLYSKGICASRINLAFLRKANRDLQTDRSIEIPACGGFMLAEWSEEHERLFEEDREAVFFRAREELVEKCRYYLSHEDERSAIARAGYERCIRDGYGQPARMKFMLEILLTEIS